MQEKKHNKEKVSSRRDGFWPEVLKTNFKKVREQWTGPWRMDRLEHAEMEVGGWIEAIPDTGHSMGHEGEPVSSSRAGSCGFPCSLWHLQALTLYMALHPKLVGWKLNTKETEFRAWLGDCPVVQSGKTTGCNQGGKGSSWLKQWDVGIIGLGIQTWRTTGLRLMAMGKRERKNEGEIDQSWVWRLETHLYQTPEKRKKRRDRQRGGSAGRSEGYSAANTRARCYKGCLGMQTEKSQE